MTSTQDDAPRMFPESLTIIGTGSALAVLVAGPFAWLRGDIRGLQDRMDHPGERIASVEDKVGLLLHGLQSRILSPNKTPATDGPLVLIAHVPKMPGGNQVCAWA